MITLNELQTIAKRFVQTHRGVHPPQLMHPLREWKIGVSIFGALVIASGVLSYIQYQSYDIHGVVEGDVAATIVPYRAAMIEEALVIYEAQKLQHQSIVNSIPAPSSRLPAAQESEEDLALPDSSALDEEGSTPESIDVMADEEPAQ